MSASAAQGRQVALAAGCAACHGTDGRGGVGPPWVRLAGSTVTLNDGSTVTADRAYLRRAVTEPRAQVVAGAAVAMPANNLTPEQVEQVVDYIEALR